jgi:hypothetical protein
METIVTEDEFKDGDVVYFISDKAQKYPLTVCDRANSDSNQIKCMRRTRRGKVQIETFWPEHLKKHANRKSVSSKLPRLPERAANVRANSHSLTS